MGIKGLTAWVNEHTGSVSNLCVLKSPTLLLDGLGLAHHLLTTCHRARHGDYAAYDAAARHFFRALLDVAGASLVLYLDGPQAAAPMKSATHAKRRTERAEAWERWQAACFDGRALDASELPPPPLLASSCSRAPPRAASPCAAAPARRTPRWRRRAAAAAAGGDAGSSARTPTSSSTAAAYARLSELYVAPASASAAEQRLWRPHERPPDGLAASDAVVLARRWDRATLSAASGCRPSGCSTGRSCSAPTTRSRSARCSRAATATATTTATTAATATAAASAAAAARRGGDGGGAAAVARAPPRVAR